MDRKLNVVQTQNQFLVRIDSECDITFFVPCYNEENNVLSTFENIIRAGREVDITYEILLVDDNRKTIQFILSKNI